MRNSQILMALGDYDGLETTRLVLTDLSFNGAYTMETARNITDVEIANQRICALGDGTVEQYSLKGILAGETTVKNNVKAIIDYQGCVVVTGDSLEKLEKADIKKK